MLDFIDYSTLRIIACQKRAKNKALSSSLSNLRRVSSKIRLYVIQ